MAYRGDIPTRDQDLEDWATPFSSKYSATPTAFGGSVPDAASVASLLSDFITRRAAATNPTTRNPSTVAAKNTSKAALLAHLRQTARMIKAFASITPSQLEELGLHVADRVPSRWPAPLTRPVVSVDKIGSLQASIRIADEMTPNSRARADQSIGLFLFLKIDGPAPASPADCQFIGGATRWSHVIDFPPGSAGKTFWVMAQWVNARLEPGPTSGVVSGTIAA